MTGEKEVSTKEELDKLKDHLFNLYKEECHSFIRYEDDDLLEVLENSSINLLALNRRGLNRDRKRLIHKIKTLMAKQQGTSIWD